MGRGSQLDQSVHAAGARLMLEDVTLKFGWCYTRGLAKSWPEHAKRRCKESCKRVGKRLPHGKLGPRGIYRERRRSSGSVIGIPIPSERRRGFAFELLAAKQPAQFDGSVLGFPLAGKAQREAHAFVRPGKFAPGRYDVEGGFKKAFVLTRRRRVRTGFISNQISGLAKPPSEADFDPKMGSSF